MTLYVRRSVMKGETALMKQFAGVEKFMSDDLCTKLMYSLEEELLRLYYREAFADVLSKWQKTVGRILSRFGSVLIPINYVDRDRLPILAMRRCAMLCDKIGRSGDFIIIPKNDIEAFIEHRMFNLAAQGKHSTVPLLGSINGVEVYYSNLVEANTMVIGRKPDGYSGAVVVFQEPITEVIPDSPETTISVSLTYRPNQPCTSAYEKIYFSVGKKPLWKRLLRV